MTIFNGKDYIKTREKLNTEEENQVTVESLKAEIEEYKNKTIELEQKIAKLEAQK